MIAFGLDLGGTKIEAAALSSGGAFLARVRVPTPGAYEAGLEAAAEVLAEAERQAGAKAARVGVGGPGSVNPHTGRMRNANSTWLNGRPFPEDLARRLARPVRYANDADCLALSESRDGAAEGRDPVFAVILGTGCGGGLSVGGRLVTGANGIAGEWGHSPLPSPTPEETPGPACWCGRRGCLETWFSGPGLARDDGRGLSAEALAGLAAQGEARALASLERHAGRLARGLAAVVNLLDPAVLVLGGGVGQIPGLAEGLADRIRPHVFSDDWRCEVVRPRFGDSSGVRGAAWLWDR
ncbi:MAG: ROK family protein [Phenylobacterium sp.]|uniref:ROK family protein n=1 Tax=Phenylobacterium sp. TaxID=1871053 RepID=UPI0025D200B3|nr:ROK family protein [Phenylobacterium sp.]MCA3738761.1 ROK family protein [Phenylobacterium sp.]MCA4916547.1 ROK family protein [Phenylobacterium sp.]